MDSNLSELKRRLLSPSQDTSAKALVVLIKMGAEAIPVFLEVLHTETTRPRHYALEGLATVADSTTSDVFFHYLNDENDKVRAWAAVGLMRINDERALDALLKTINDYPDVLHSEHTLTTYALIQYGTRAIPKLIHNLDSNDVWTRKRTMNVLRGIISKMPDYQNKWESLWEENGSYSPNIEPIKQQNAIGLWKKWLEKQSF